MTFAIRRLMLTVPVLVLITLMVFSLIHLVPGDPATVILGEEATPQAKAELDHQLGLDLPLPTQYFNWLGHVARGDLGKSLIDQTSVAQVIGQRLPVTVELAIVSFIIALLIAIPAGIFAATFRGKLPDYVSTMIAFAGMSIPSFWLGIMAIIFFAVRLGWLPSSGFVPLTQDPLQNLKYMILPAAVTGFRESAVLMRMLRSSLLEVMSLEYIRTARSKGLRKWTVILRHGVRNALIPVATSSGLAVAGLLGGLVLTETVFNIPGFGKLIVTAIFQRDFVTVQGAVLISALLVIGVNLVVDITYAVLDPRIRLS